MKEMWSPQTIIPLDSITERLRPSTHFQAYGLGWSLSDYRGRKLVAHGGAIDGFRAVVGLVPEERLGVVVLSNGGEPRSRADERPVPARGGCVPGRRCYGLEHRTARRA